MKYLLFLCCAFLCAPVELIAAEKNVRPNVVFIVADDLGYGHWKLLRESKAWQLYDLDTDIGETKDLAASQPEQVKQLSTIWDTWNAEQMEPLWR
ncbi:MAG: hypothetical protein NTY15_00440 [Planctomycetota bacterium]|jgi:arylsulfatase A-like enzyme|nr:hypothetical protein [Planctomycetota bacterium]